MKVSTISNRVRLVILVLLLLASTQPTHARQRVAQDHNSPDAKNQRRHEHSKLYAGRGTGNLRKLAAEAEVGDEIFSSQVCSMTVGLPYPPLFNLFDFLKGISCEADAVVSGVIKDKASFLTDDEQYVFTDYTLTVEEVFKDDLTSPIEMHSEIVVTRPCGTITIDGRKVGVTDVVMKSLEKDGRYVLLLKRVPDAGTYSALTSHSGFELRDGRVIKATEVHLGMETEDDASGFLTALRIAAGSCSKKK
jgi:hypothetical protein